MSGSIRETVWSGLRVHTAPAATTMSGWPQLKVAIAALPVRSGSLTVCVTAPVPGSTRETLTV